MVQAVIVEPFRKLPKNLSTQVFGNVALVVDFSDRPRDLGQLFIEQQKDAPSIVSDSTRL